MAEDVEGENSQIEKKEEEEEEGIVQEEPFLSVADGYGWEEEAQKEEENGEEWRDRFAALLFALNYLVMFLLLVVGSATKPSSSSSSSSSGGGDSSSVGMMRNGGFFSFLEERERDDSAYSLSSSSSSAADRPPIIIVVIKVTISLLTSLPLCLICCRFAIKFLQTKTKYLVYFVFGCSLFICFLGGILFLILPSPHPIALSLPCFLLGAGILGLSMLVRERVDFAIDLLQTTATLTERYPGTLYISFFSVFPTFIFFVFFGATLFYTLHFGIGCRLYLVFCFYWFAGTASEVVHVSCSGASSFWYFGDRRTEVGAVFHGKEGEKEEEEEEIEEREREREREREIQREVESGGLVVREIREKEVVRASFLKAVSTSFGSICLASLFTPFLRLFRFVLNVGGVWEMVRPFCECGGKIHAFALTYVAVFEIDYFSASRLVSELFERTKIEVIINDDITWWVLRLIVFCISGICGIVGSLIGYFAVPGYSGMSIIAFFLSFVFSLYISNVVMNVIDTAVETFYVCFAEKPECLKELDETLFLHLQEGYATSCPELFNKN